MRFWVHLAAEIGYESPFWYIDGGHLFSQPPRAAATLKLEHMSLQILSTHLPSHLNCSPDEFDHHVSEMGSRLVGARRSRLPAGVDSNLQLDSRQHGPNIIGSAMKTLSSSGPSTQGQENGATFVNEISAKGMRVMNTFESFWKAPGMEDNERHQRFTWEGNIVGHTSRRAIDYIMMDQTAAAPYPQRQGSTTCRTPATTTLWASHSTCSWTCTSVAEFALC